MVTYSFLCFPAGYIISFCILFLLRADELNKLACLQCMGLHRSASRALQRDAEATGSNPVEAPREKLFFRLLRKYLNCDSTAMVNRETEVTT